MMDKKVWLLTILAVLLFTACATVQEYAKMEPSLPNDVKIIPPAPDLRKDIAAFSGKWVGSTKGIAIYDMILVVEEIHDTWAQVINSVGRTQTSSPIYRRQKCRVIADPKPEIVWEFPGLPKFSFTMKDSNTLEGNRLYEGGVLTATLKRAN
jgi:hypothetical protein